MFNKKWAPFFWSYYRSYKPHVCMFVLFSGLVGLHALFNSYLTKKLIDTLEMGAANFQNFLIPVLLILGNYELHNLCWRGIQLINLKLIPEIKNQITQDLFAILHKKPYRDVQESFSGSHASNITILTQALERLTNNVFIRLIRGGVQLIAALIMMASVHPLFSIIFFLWTLFFVSLSLLFSKKIRFLSNDLAKKHSEVSGKVVDSLSNGKDVRLFSQIFLEISLLKGTLKKLKKAYQTKGRFFLKFYFVQGFSITCLIGGMVYTLLQLRLTGRVTIGDFAFILGATFFLTDMVWSNTELIDQLNDEIGQCNQSLRAIFFRKEQSEEGKKLFQFHQGGIVFHNISFSYSPDKPIFIDQSLRIEPGEKVGLVGRSGAGKSTLIHLLLSLYPVQKGKIFIDGQDIKTLSPFSLHQAIGILSQDFSLFHRSLLDNIRFGKAETSDDDVIEAARRAGIDTFVSSLPENYHTLLGERGIKLSGGQRQKVALARVILKNAPLLILDEPTSQLDSLSEQELEHSLYPFMEGKTTIAIAHRLSTLVRMDRICVLDRGKIIEEGSHAHLMEQNGMYHEMWEAQSGKAHLTKLFLNKN